MKNLFRIARWEFMKRLKSRSFLFNTFISPFLFVAILFIPIYFFQYSNEVSTKLIGAIDLSGQNIANELQTALNKNFRLENNTPEYMVLKISASNSESYSKMFNEVHNIRLKRDSISLQYNRIKKKRSIYYQNLKLKNRRYLLETSYDHLQRVREERELIQIELSRNQNALDSLYKQEAKKMADSLLTKNIINSYLIFSSDLSIDYYTKNSGDFLEWERFENILHTLAIKKRILNDKINRGQVLKWFKDVKIRKFHTQENADREWNFYIQFYGPLFSAFLLFMAIFTSSGFLFSGVLQEKSNRVIEILLSYATSRQIMGGKIIGLSVLGFVQLLIWFILTILFIVIGFIPAQGIDYMNITNAFYFLLYFFLGFLFYGAIFTTVGAVSANEFDAQQVNQFLRSIAIIPMLLSLMIFTNPDSQMIHILSYIPFLTPFFMIIRIPLSSGDITNEIYLTGLVMMISNVLLIYAAAKIFRMATLMQGKRPSWTEIVHWLKQS
jgi:ABC-2 type transport system permease protein